MSPQPKPKAVRLKGKAYTDLRRKAWQRAHGKCEVCGAWAPLRDQDGRFDVFGCGHVCHFKSRGAGGADTMDNVYWGCYECHIRKEHGPQWRKP